MIAGQDWDWQEMGIPALTLMSVRLESLAAIKDVTIRILELVKVPFAYRVICS